MNKTLLTIAAATALMAGAEFTLAQTTTTTTTTWTTDQGAVIREYSTTRNYASYSDPSFQPAVGVELPAPVTVYTLPETVSVPASDGYRYAIINNRTVIVDAGNRRILYMFNPPAGDG